MSGAGAVTLGDLHRQGRLMIEIGCVKCPRYGSHRLDKLLALCGSWRRSCRGTVPSAEPRRSTIRVARIV
jgi:hypothetical protein